MRIRVDEVPDSGRHVHLHWDEDRLNQFLPPDDPFELKLIRPVNVDLEIDKRTDHVHIGGRIRGEVQMVCHRCLTPFVWQLDEPIEVFLVTEAPQTEEVELEEDDLDYEFFDGEVIEIDQLIAEQIFLALPFKVLCSESCRGLCPGCGVNLNETECKCKRDTRESPFAKLKQAKDQLPGSNEA